MWCLARLLPLIIGNEIPDDNDNWCNYLLLLDILDYIFAPSLTPQSVAHLKILIDEHHQAFKRLYPDCPITPKMHYIIHYPDLILRSLSFPNACMHALSWFSHSTFPSPLFHAVWLSSLPLILSPFISFSLSLPFSFYFPLSSHFFSLFALVPLASPFFSIYMYSISLYCDTFKYT